MATDTSCSSGLVAASVAHDAILSGSCERGLATAIFVMLLPAGHEAQARAGMLSRAGRCFTFDARADGFMKGEGSGGVALQPDGQQLRAARAVLRGRAVRQDGRSASLTAPNGAAQQALCEHAMHVGSVAASQVALLEAHGTGTALGDPTEVSSLCEAVLKARGSQAAPLALGSVKANTGHAEPAAGLSGLSMLLLKVEAGNMYDCGADIQWLSMYPAEKEVLFPPLTYMKATHIQGEAVGSHPLDCTVITVTPRF